MESRVGWQRAMAAAQRHRVWVLHSGQTSSDTLAERARLELPTADIQFIAIEQGKVATVCDDTLDLFWLRYRWWHRRALDVAQKLHAEVDFDLVHQASICGYRQPGLTWKLGVPFVWGPVGGTQNFPWRFLGECDLWGGTREVLRNLLNSWQLRFGRRIRRAGEAACSVLAATEQAASDLQHCCGIDSTRVLETGVDPVDTDLRQVYDKKRPLRLLWAGRQRTWKGLPLLLKALAQLPDRVAYELRIVGEGACESKWKKLASELGLVDHVEWVGWPTYSETLPHYRWADAFVFTSLRDTSGTGLLESLAAGAPIVGLNHQGAADIMTPDCAVPIEVRSPRQVIDDLTLAIRQLADNPVRLEALSRGAILRSRLFHWDTQAANIEKEYQRALVASGACSSIQQVPAATVSNNHTESNNSQVPSAAVSS